MTSLERAKRFISQHGKAIALTIVPLAGLAVSPPARALGTSQGFSPAGCTVSEISSGNGFVSGSCFGSSDGINSANNLTGVKMFTGASGSFAPYATNNPGSGGTSLFGLDFLETGAASVGYPSDSLDIPLSWNFSATNTDQNTLDYQLTYTFYGSLATQLPNTSQAGTQVASVTEYSASGTDTVNFGGVYVTGYSIDLRVSEIGSGTITVNIPPNSVDVNEATSATPEPASFLLLGTGLAGMLYRLRRRKA